MLHYAAIYRTDLILKIPTEKVYVVESAKINERETKNSDVLYWEVEKRNTCWNQRDDKE